MRWEIKYPLVIVNFKTYMESTVESAAQLASIAERISNETGVSIAVAPQILDLKNIITEVSIPILAQHVDPYDPGAHTGYASIEALERIGTSGSIVNHSEHMMKLSEIDLILKKMRRLGLVSVVCTNTAHVSAAVTALEPDMVAIEPPELIGTGIPVSKAKPEIVTDTIALIEKINPNLPVLCGAGITKGEDATAAVKLGTKGVLVSSGVVKAKDPSKALTDLARAIS